MSFRQFSLNVNQQVQKMMQQRELYCIAETSDLMESYLAAFPEGTDPVFRTNTQHNCSCCRNFIKNMGGVVAIIDGHIVTVWENTGGLNSTYHTVSERMDAIVRQQPIGNIFRTSESKFGNEATVGDKYIGSHHIWDHFWTPVDRKFQNNQPDTERGRAYTNYDVLNRAFNMMHMDVLNQVADLIKNDMLYRGQEHERVVKAFQEGYKQWQAARDKHAFVWQQVHNMGLVNFKNSVIGSLVWDIADGVDLEEAVRRFEGKVAPQNYKRSKSLITAKMVDEALAKLNELGMEHAIERRVAVFQDVSVNDVLFVNNIGRMKMKDGLKAKILEGHERAIPTRESKNNITIQDFLDQIVPNATDIRLLFQNKHLGNLMTLTAPVVPSEIPLFQWANSFGWSYKDGNADSIRERVKRAGGNVDAKLRVSLSWFNGDDLDLHIISPHGHIFFGNRENILDVDMNAGAVMNPKDPVENQSFKVPKSGTYKVYVHNYRKRNADPSKRGFDMEFFYNGQSRFFSFNHVVQENAKVQCFSFTLDKQDQLTSFNIDDKALSESMRSQAVWGIQTETMQNVTTLLNSPNHWEGAGAVGQKHWFFILDGCATPEPTRGIYNEFLAKELHPHRKVFEVLGSKTMCDPLPSQMSGLGFTLGRDQSVSVIAVTRTGRIGDFNITF
jgi:hypothetical protein